MRYLEHKVTMRIRYSEVDAMDVVWHGNYVKYLEDGRESLGEALGMSYRDVGDQGFFLPVVNVNIDFKSPATFGDPIEITCRLIETRAAKVIHEYEVKNLRTGNVCCTGTTQQVFINRDTKELELVFPTFYADWKTQMNWLEE